MSERWWWRWGSFGDDDDDDGKRWIRLQQVMSRIGNCLKQAWECFSSHQSLEFPSKLMNGFSPRVVFVSFVLCDYPRGFIRPSVRYPGNVRSSAFTITVVIDLPAVISFSDQTASAFLAEWMESICFPFTGMEAVGDGERLSGNYEGGFNCAPSKYKWEREHMSLFALRMFMSKCFLVLARFWKSSSFFYSRSGPAFLGFQAIWKDFLNDCLTVIHCYFWLVVSIQLIFKVKRRVLVSF